MQFFSFGPSTFTGPSIWLEVIKGNLGHYFPQFCSGPCNGLSRESAQKIFETAKQTETNGFRLEDVLFLGIIREKAKMEIPHFEKVFIQIACTS